MNRLVLGLTLLTATSSLAATRGWAVVSFGAREGTGDVGAGADESSLSVGLHVAVRPQDWPIGLMAGYQAADDFNFCLNCSEGSLNVEVGELSLGVERTFDLGKRFRPWIGGGLSRFDADLQLHRAGSDANGSDDDWGFFLGGGARWSFGHFTTGLDGRIGLGATVRIEDAERDLDYWEASWVIGVSW